MAARLELFYDTETALRLVDDEVRAMTGGLPTSSSDVLPMTHVLEHIRDEVLTVLATVRDGRSPSTAAALGVGDDQRAIEVVHGLADLESRLALMTQLLESSVMSGPEPTAGLLTRGSCVRGEAAGRHPAFVLH